MILAAVSVLVAILVQRVTGRWGFAGAIVNSILSVGVVLSLYVPVRKFLGYVMYRYLFSDEGDYQKLLKDASRGMSSIESLNHLTGLILHFITMKMRVKNAAILIRGVRGPDFYLVCQRGYDKQFLSLELSAEDPLLQYLATRKQAVDISKIWQKTDTGDGGRAAGECGPIMKSFRTEWNLCGRFVVSQVSWGRS